MQKPTPRNHFINEADEQEHVLNCMCWMFADRMALDLDMTQGHCADVLKEMVSEGRIIIDVAANNRVRITMAPSSANN